MKRVHSQAKKEKRGTTRTEYSIGGKEEPLVSHPVPFLRAEGDLTTNSAMAERADPPEKRADPPEEGAQRHLHSNVSAGNPDRYYKSPKI